MIGWYLDVRKLLREMHSKALDAQKAWNSEDKELAKTIHGYMKKDYQRLQQTWNETIKGDVPSSLGRHIAFAMANDVDDILQRDIPELDEHLDSLIGKTMQTKGDEGFRHLLHPVVVKSSYEQFQSGHFRDAVLNAVVAIFDLIRKRIGIDLDGSALATKAFSLTNPYLVLSDLQTESGRNDQKGFIQMLSGSYQGIRNTNAHSLNHDLDEVKAAQYLVHASLLTRRVAEARSMKNDSRPKGAER